MPDVSPRHDVEGLTTGELERARRELHASLALIRPGSAARVPILGHLRAVEAVQERNIRNCQDKETAMRLTFRWVPRSRRSRCQDKRRAVWIAAEDCPDGEQVEDTDLDVLLARLPATDAASGLSSKQSTSTRCGTWTTPL